MLKETKMNKVIIVLLLSTLIAITGNGLFVLAKENKPVHVHVYENETQILYMFDGDKNQVFYAYTYANGKLYATYQSKLNEKGYGFLVLTRMETPKGKCKVYTTDSSQTIKYDKTFFKN